MKRKLVILLFLIFSSIYFVLYAISTTAAPAPPVKAPIDEEEEQIVQAVLEAVQGEREFVLGFLVNEVKVADIQLSKDGSWGIAYLEMIDPATGEVLPTEPGLAITRKVGNEWQVTLPADTQWLELMASTPQDLLTDEHKLYYEELSATESLGLDATYGGYLLPWETGRTVYLSQSVGHDQYIPSGSAHYSFDFYIHKTMYNLHAAKSGTVWRTRWDVPNGDDSDMGNYIVLKDISTTPTTYQLYLHLAQNSIPPELRSAGAFVAQGDLIGIADDTGKSTGHHLHFQVHTNPNSYWGTSVDITFDDVDINGGRPRRESDLPFCKAADVCESFRNFYISGNDVFDDGVPPVGDLFEPSTGYKATSSSVHVEGWAFDEDSGLARARIIAYFNDSWHEVGDEINNLTFSLDWDMCSDQVPDGPVSLAIRAWDNAGNVPSGLPGLTHLIKEFSCDEPAPICVPGVNQVAIFSEVNYQGECQVLGPGEYSDQGSFGPLDNDEVDSIMVGSDVLIALYSESNFSGRAETLVNSDSNLDDNLVGRNTLSSTKVVSKSTPPPPPDHLIAPLTGETYEAYASISFSWRDPGGGIQFQVLLESPTEDIYSPWLTESFWLPEGIVFQQGNYSWKVRARSCDQDACTSPWSQTSSFSITAGASSLSSVSAPFSDDVESGDGNWNLTGLWKRIDDVERAHSQNFSWYYGNIPERNYDTGGPNSGNLTSRPVQIPGSNYVLKFWYRYDTEGSGNAWDQRWVQISTDGELFDNILQLHDDVENYWLNATLDLSDYAGQTIYVRFHFTSLDDLNNFDHEGWYLDDIQIIEEIPPSCSDTDNTPSGARTISFNETLSGKLCPAGDVDYYKFEGSAGDRIVLDIDTPANPPVEDLDLIIFLLDNDGSSVLAIHDDEIYGEKFDPHLGYLLTRSGTYFVRSRLWSHPSAGGDEFTYNLTLLKDKDKPIGEFIYPHSFTYLTDSDNLSIEVDAVDQGSDISRVEFLFHSGDWLNSSWSTIGVDQDGNDGWKTLIDATNMAEQNNMAFFAKIFDWAGNWRGIGAWELGLDRTPPVTGLESLAPEQESTAIFLEWDSYDNLAGVDYFEIQSRLNNSPWTVFTPNPPGTSLQTWFIGEPDSEYEFRLRGVDFAGNQEAFPNSAESQTIIPPMSIICSTPDPWDSTGDDNSALNAAAVDVEEPSKYHNFCNPLVPDRMNDEDWVIFSVESGKTYIMESTPLSPMTGVILELYAADGKTLISSAQSSEFGKDTRIIWTSGDDNQVLLRVRHLNGKVAGNIVSYELRVNRFNQNFLPIIKN